MSASQQQIKTTAMNRFIRTFGGMVADGDQPDEALTEIFEEFDSPETMFAWLAERWVAGGFDDSEAAGTKKTKTKTKNKDPDKPKWCNAYMHFTMAQRATVKEANPDMSNTEVTKELGRMWREDLGDEEKEPYQTASDEQKAAYDSAMASYTPPTSDGEAESPKKGRKKRQEGAPKKSLNAYMHFTMAQRASVKEENPDMSNTEVTKELGRMWREDMGDEDKAEYQQAAAEDKARYDREMESYDPSATATPPKESTKKAPAKKTTTSTKKKAPAPKEAPSKKAAKKEAPAKKEPPAKKAATKKAATKKATPKKAAKKDTQMEEAYAIFVEVESAAAAEERADGEEEPLSPEEMEEHLNAIWEDLSHEDRLEYLESRE